MLLCADTIRIRCSYPEVGECTGYVEGAIEVNAMTWIE